MCPAPSLRATHTLCRVKVSERNSKILLRQTYLDARSINTLFYFFYVSHMKTMLLKIRRKWKWSFILSIFSLILVSGIVVLANGKGENIDMMIARISNNREIKSSIILSISGSVDQELINTMDMIDIPDDKWDELREINKLNRLIRADKESLVKRADQMSTVLSKQ